MKRHEFLKNTSIGLMSLGSLFQLPPRTGISWDEKISSQAHITLDEGNIIHYYSKAVTLPLNILLAADTHLWMSDEREDPYRIYSDRMARTYNRTSHFQTGEATNPEESFENMIQLAIESDVDLLALPGDIFSWPSEAAIEWAYEKLEKSGVPYIYVAGNHDWHYEGMEGSLEELRDTWINKRLLPLYQGQDPLMAAYDLKGIRFVVIDNSTYQISKEQLDFFQDHAKSEMPLVLILHIPMYASGKPVNYGCGHPEWGAETDKLYEIERRPRWPESGHTSTTMNFYQEVFTASNILGIFAGHIHNQSIEYINGVPQFVADDNASGAFLDISFDSLSQKDVNLLNDE